MHNIFSVFFPVSPSIFDIKYGYVSWCKITCSAINGKGAIFGINRVTGWAENLRDDAEGCS